jgi:hypothetical protein
MRYAMALALGLVWVVVLHVPGLTREFNDAWLALLAPRYGVRLSAWLLRWPPSRGMAFAR